MTRFTVKRLGDEPIVQSGLAQAIGAKINGPSAIRVPDWIEAPLGRYYLKLADRQGDRIRLAYSLEIPVPTHVHEPGLLRLEASGIPTQFSEFNLPERFRNSVVSGGLRPHNDSPVVHVDRARQPIVIHCRCLERDCTQIIQCAVSKNGFDFLDPQPNGADYYARVFEWQGVGYASELAAWLYRLRDSGLSFPGRTRLGDPSTRHVAFFPYEDLPFQILSRFGDAPERLLISRIFATVDWRDWSLSDPLEFLRAEMPREGAGKPILPSRACPADGLVSQLRDPFVLIEDYCLWLFYACASESSLGLARLHIMRMAKT
ncbi:MAG: hypothetical protein OXN84_20505 [Albidovulum sp.]|nr:hypothetical protein [Albidovulum sp.]